MTRNVPFDFLRKLLELDAWKCDPSDIIHGWASFKKKISSLALIVTELEALENTPLYKITITGSVLPIILKQSLWNSEVTLMCIWGASKINFV